MEENKDFPEKQKKRKSQSNTMRKDNKKKPQDGHKQTGLQGTIQHFPGPDQMGTSVSHSEFSDRLVPEQTRPHNIPPKKSLSPSFLASHVFQGAQEGGIQQPEQLHTVQHHPTSQSNPAGNPISRGPPDMRFMSQMLSQQVGQTMKPFDQGGLLRQQLLQGPPKSSPSHYRQDAPIYHSPPPNRTVHNIPSSLPGRSLEMAQNLSGLQARTADPGILRVSTAQSQDIHHNIHDTTSGRKLETEGPYHVSTIRRTPSPAPKRPTSPQYRHGVSPVSGEHVQQVSPASSDRGYHHERISPAPGERTQMSLEDAIKLMQGHPAASLQAQVLAQLTQQQQHQPRTEPEEIPKHYFSRFPEPYPDFYHGFDFFGRQAKEPTPHKAERSSKQFISTMLANQAKNRQASTAQPMMVDQASRMTSHDPSVERGIPSTMESIPSGIKSSHGLVTSSLPSGLMMSGGLTVDTSSNLPLPASQFVRVSPGGMPRQPVTLGGLQRQVSPSSAIVRQVSPSGGFQRLPSGVVLQRQVSPSGVKSASQLLQQGVLTQTGPLLQPQPTSSANNASQRIPSPKPQHRHKDFAQAQKKEQMAHINLQDTIAGSQPIKQHVSYIQMADRPIKHPVTNVHIPENSGPIRQPVVELVKLPIPKSVEGKPPTFSASHMTSQLTNVTSQVPFSHLPQSLASTMVTGQAKVNPGIVNPFTFPTQPSAIVPQADNQPRYEVISPVVPPEQKRKLSDVEMPQLDPVPPLQKESSPMKVEMVKMKNPFNMRMQNLANLPTNSMYRATYRAHSLAVHRAKAGLITSTAKTLDLLRQNLQKFINKEIDVIVKQYLDTYFKPGIENIKSNNGETSVTDEHVQAVCRQILEEAKKMYTSEQRSVTPVRDENTPLPLSRKRNASDTDSDKSGPNFIRKKKGRPPIYSSGRSTPSKPAKTNEPVKREGPKWDSNRLVSTTQYIMGARANKALGLGATRGRIYIKHPDVFKYCGDQDDKQWLYENHKMPATGGKAYMMLLEDVKDLAEDEEYRNNPNVMMDEIVGFCIPDWLTEKVKVQMEGLRTDKAKQRSRSTTPSNGQLSTQQDDGDMYKGLPFSNFSTSKGSPALTDKEEIQTSPSADTEMEFLTGGGNVDQNQLSPFNLTGGFDDGVSPSASDLDNLDDEAPLSAPFEFSK